MNFSRMSWHSSQKDVCISYGIKLKQLILFFMCTVACYKIVADALEISNIEQINNIHILRHSANYSESSSNTQPVNVLPSLSILNQRVLYDDNSQLNLAHNTTIAPNSSKIQYNGDTDSDKSTENILVDDTYEAYTIHKDRCTYDNGFCWASQQVQRSCNSTHPCTLETLSLSTACIRMTPTDLAVPELCNPSNKPISSEIYNVTVVNEYTWRIAGWSDCTGGRCQPGHQSRFVDCVDASSHIVVLDSYCGEDKPATSQSCATPCTYDWQTGAWSACSSINPCITGTKTRTITCKNELGATVEEDKCTKGKPVTSESCVGQGSCVYRWVEDAWSSCSQTSRCASGTQTRTVTCQDQSNRLVDNSYCSGNGNKPDTSQTCVTPCTYAWETGAWTGCSSTNPCIAGIKTRNATCKNELGTTVNEDKCINGKPVTSESCTGQGACEYRWVEDAWSTCSQTSRCATGTQSRDVTCQDQSNRLVDNSYCSGNGNKPDTSQTCVTPCTYAWETDAWSACSSNNPCITGTKTRTITCKNELGATVDEDKCTKGKPATSEPCTGQGTCEYRWVEDAWSACSETSKCTSGTQNRDVTCQDQTNRAADDSNCKENKPVTSQSCVTPCTYDWKPAAWSVCSSNNPCITGTKTRTITCKNELGATVDEDKCITSKPVTSEPCTGQGTCEYRWVENTWSACSETNRCASGTQSRDVTCQDQTNRIVLDSYCSGNKPTTSQSCVTPCTYDWEPDAWNGCSSNNPCITGTKTRTITCKNELGAIADENKCVVAKPATSESCVGEGTCVYDDVNIMSWLSLPIPTSEEIIKTKPIQPILPHGNITSLKDSIYQYKYLTLHTTISDMNNVSYSEFRYDILLSRDYRFQQQTKDSMVCTYSATVLEKIDDKVPHLVPQISSIGSKHTKTLLDTHPITGVYTISITFLPFSDIVVSNHSYLDIQLHCEGVGQPLFVNYANSGMDEDIITVNLYATRHYKEDLLVTEASERVDGGGIKAGGIIPMTQDTPFLLLTSKQILYKPIINYPILPFLLNTFTSFTPNMENTPSKVQYTLESNGLSCDKQVLKIILPPGTSKLDSIPISCEVSTYDVTKPHTDPILVKSSIISYTNEVVLFDENELPASPTASNPLVPISSTLVTFDIRQKIDYYQSLLVECTGIRSPPREVGGYLYYDPSENGNDSSHMTKTIPMTLAKTSKPFINLQCSLSNTSTSDVSVSIPSILTQPLDEYIVEFTTKIIYVDAYSGKFSLSISSIPKEYLYSHGILSFAVPERLEFAETERLKCDLILNTLDSENENENENEDDEIPLPVHITTFPQYEVDGPVATQGRRYRISVELDQSVTERLRGIPSGYDISCSGSRPIAIEIVPSTNYYVEYFYAFPAQQAASVEILSPSQPQPFHELLNSSPEEVLDILLNGMSSVIATDSASLLSSRAPPFATEVIIEHSATNAGTLGTLMIESNDILQTITQNSIFEISFPHQYQYIFNVYEAMDGEESRMEAGGNSIEYNNNDDVKINDVEDIINDNTLFSKCLVYKRVYDISSDVIFEDIEIDPTFYLVSFSATSHLASTVTASTANQLSAFYNKHILMIRFTPFSASVIFEKEENMFIRCINVRSPINAHPIPLTTEEKDLFPKATVSLYKSLSESYKLNSQLSFTHFAQSPTSSLSSSPSQQFLSRTPKKDLSSSLPITEVPDYVDVDTLTFRASYTSEIMLPSTLPQQPKRLNFFVFDQILNKKTLMVIEIELNYSFSVLVDQKYVTIATEIPLPWTLSDETICYLSVNSPYLEDATINGILEKEMRNKSFSSFGHSERQASISPTAITNFSISNSTPDRLKFTFAPPSMQLLASETLYLFCTEIYTGSIDSSNLRNYPDIPQPHSGFLKRSRERQSSFEYPPPQTQDKQDGQRTSQAYLQKMYPYRYFTDDTIYQSTQPRQPIQSNLSTEIITFETIALNLQINSVLTDNQSTTSTPHTYIEAVDANRLIITSNEYPSHISSLVTTHKFVTSSKFNQGQLETWIDIFKTLLSLRYDKSIQIHLVTINTGSNNTTQDRKLPSQNELYVVEIIAVIASREPWLQVESTLSLIKTQKKMILGSLLQAYPLGNYTFEYYKSSILSHCFNTSVDNDNDETDINCGGNHDSISSCGRCFVGQQCLMNEDCWNSNCQNNICVEDDNTKKK